MLAIKRIKDVKAGKRIGADSNRLYATQVSVARALPCRFIVLDVPVR